MVASPNRLTSLPRSIPAIASRLLLGPAPCQRSPWPANADDRSVPTPGSSRTSRPTRSLSPASDPLGGGENRASSNATTSLAPCSIHVCKLGSFFSKRVRRFAQLLGHMETIDHRLALGQHFPTRSQVRRPHVGAVREHRSTLLQRQHFQTFLARRLVTPFGYRQDLRLGRIGQVGQNRRVGLV